jgi:cation:H+ antiporter
MIGFVLFALGLAGVVAGAYLLVLGASRLATALGVPSVVVGMTVVGFGTSMPELVTSAIASWEGHPETALGNVVGSNIANVALILGLSAVIIPLVPDRTLLRREGPVLIGVSAVVVLLGLTGAFDPWMGVLLLAGLAVFLVASFWWSRDEPEVVVDQVEHFREQSGLAREKPAWLSALYAVGGIALLGAGGYALVDGAVDIAGNVGIQEFALATTVVAVGTSLPELATSLTAALRREADIAIGNVVGSNIFNLLGVLGLAAVIGPIPLTDEMRWLDMPWMAGLSVIGVMFARQGYALGRQEGAALLFAWVVYVVWLVWR